MPTYVYKFVKTGETIEVDQAFTDPTLEKLRHPGTGRLMAVKKVFQPVGVTFKGGGFYKTDSRSSTGRGRTDSGSDSSSDSGSSSTEASSDSSSTATSSTSSDSATSTKDAKPAKAAKAAGSKPAAKPAPKSS